MSTNILSVLHNGNKKLVNTYQRWRFILKTICKKTNNSWKCSNIKKNKPKRVFSLQVRCRESDIFKIFGIFWEIVWKFFGFLGDFFKNYFGGIFWEKFFGRIFLGGFFWRIHLEDFFGRIFFGGFFEWP